MGNSISIKKMNYEDIQEIVKGNIDCILINTKYPSEFVAVPIDVPEINTLA